MEEKANQRRMKKKKFVKNLKIENFLVPIGRASIEYQLS